LELAQVSGRVTSANQPFSGAIYFQSEVDGGTSAMGLLDRDGSFQLCVNGQRDRPGALPGTYRVFVRPRDSDQTGPRIDSKYQDPRTTDVLVEVRPDWNYVGLNLQ
jgi:hypothetical protein